MPQLKALQQNATLLDVFRAYPGTARPLIEYHEILLRGDSPLNVAERELIAAYVSGLNACSYCHGVHAVTAQAWGIEDSILRELLEDIDAASVSPKLKPILHYVRKLTVKPNSVTTADAEAVFTAGWDDKAFYDAISICALFNFMNRLVEGLGIEAGPEYFQLSGERLHKGGYAGLLRLLDQ
ncbi:MAG: peroxidase-related enzyme [Alphaproteobacteria bacterium]|nr:peroxidase-related enzyme [Alphaproteobacteria bacterium]MDE2496070.1 peroxidase-related enzyme [Alphaproteobacteria bacterium]